MEEINQSMSPRDVVAEMDGRYALFGLLFALQNRLQAVGDTFYDEITCKQFFLMACMNLFQGEAPTVQDLSAVMGSSHQNVKQILLKLEKKGFVSITVDEKDKRKQRVGLTQKCKEFCEANDEKSMQAIITMFEGVSREQLQITIQTIMQMEDNLKKL